MMRRTCYRDFSDLTCCCFDSSIDCSQKRKRRRGRSMIGSSSVHVDGGANRCDCGFEIASEESDCSFFRSRNHRLLPSDCDFGYEDEKGVAVQSRPHRTQDNVRAEEDRVLSIPGEVPHNRDREDHRSLVLVLPHHHHHEEDHGKVRHPVDSVRGFRCGGGDDDDAEVQSAIRNHLSAGVCHCPRFGCAAVLRSLASLPSWSQDPGPS
jgi:hypothetical protein